MQSKFKKGDIVKIPTTCSNEWSIKDFRKEVGGKFPYLRIIDVSSSSNIGISGPNGEWIKNNSFCEEDLEFYTESMEILSYF